MLNKATEKLDDSKKSASVMLAKMKLTNAALLSGSVEKLVANKMPITSLRSLLDVQDFLDSFGCDGLVSKNIVWLFSRAKFIL